MKITEKYIAKITNNVDLLKEGRVQFYIPELMHDPLTEIPETDYPWARQDKEMSSDIPEIDEYVWIYWHDETYWRNPFYGNKVTLKEYQDHKKFEDEIKSSLSGFLSTYPDVKFKYLPNKICWGASSSSATPEFFIAHPKGTIIFIDSLGMIKIQNSTISLKEILSDIQAVLQNLMTPGILLGNLAAPVVNTQVVTDLAKATALLGKITGLMGT